MQPPRSARPTIGVGEDDLVTGDAVALRVPAAGPGLRVASGAIDVVCGALLLFGLSLAFGGVLGDLDEAAGAALVLTTVVTTLVILPAVIETLTRGRSVGKLATGTCIVRDDGGPVAFRQCLTRSLIGFLEIWSTSGAVAFCAVVLTARGKRLGDLAAGTYAVRDRLRLQLPPPVPPAPELSAWAASADIAPLPDALSLATRQFLHRREGLDPVARARIAQELAATGAQHVMPPPPAGTHPEALLQTVVAERGRRDAQRLARDAATRHRVLPHV
ncbi:RDD family protein [Arsenicicoccus bolidensis]|uniref:RDD family protein n=1 Tax=Arsenicicoccus bolidensis TaxID=229480 RepID=UPI0028AB3B34|nr:RDD family protein [Arsenicicoccus bolidensis]